MTPHDPLWTIFQEHCGVEGEDLPRSTNLHYLLIWHNACGTCMDLWGEWFFREGCIGLSQNRELVERPGVVTFCGADHIDNIT